MSTTTERLLHDPTARRMVRQHNRDRAWGGAFFWWSAERARENYRRARNEFEQRHYADLEIEIRRRAEIKGAAKRAAR